MSKASRNNSAHGDRLVLLTQSYCNGCLDAEGWRELEDLITQDKAAMQYYVDAVQLSVELSYRLGDPELECLAELIEGGLKVSEDEWPVASKLSMQGNSGQNVLRSGAKVGRRRGSRNSKRSIRRSEILVSSVVAALLLLGFSLLFFKGSELPGTNLDVTGLGVAGATNDAVGETAKVDIGARDKEEASGEFVARVIRVSSDVSWSDRDAVPKDFLLRLHADERLSVVTGFVEVEFYSGARVILHGPAAFVPRGSDSARLEYGKLTGQVSKGEFHLEAGAADVLDLGTEFGVSVDLSAGTDICVFDGQVAVTPKILNGGQQEAHYLAEGMAMHVSQAGLTDFDKVIKTEGFTRQIPTESLQANTGTLTLIDIFCGGNGHGELIAGAINPLTGDWSRNATAAKLRGDLEQSPTDSSQFKDITGDGIYHACICNALIDGFFLPKSGESQFQPDSTGQILPVARNNGRSYGPIWVRRNSPFDVLRAEDSATDFWGTGTLRVILKRLTSAKDGMLGIHPNVGVTFDLTEIRKKQQQKLVGFRSLLANIDNGEEYAADNPSQIHSSLYLRRTADLRIYVDGELRYSRLDFSREDGEAAIDFVLQEEDRFLTILSTDAGFGNFLDNEFDHVVLIDPEFVLK